jgi:catalase
MTNQPGGVATRKIAILMADGTDAAAVTSLRRSLEGQGAVCEVVAPYEGQVGDVPVDKQLSAAASVLYDAVVAADGGALAQVGAAQFFVREAFKHGKAIGAVGSGRQLLDAARLPGDQGVVTGDDIAQAFAEAVGKHRFFDRDISSLAA